ncbi:MAG TPA: signal peptidase I [Chthoniobacteraceae bacterium]|jgi:signal peptidase I|nr:signal peptidase I [Chthoniobacteraceae bacterium]
MTEPLPPQLPKAKSSRRSRLFARAVIAVSAAVTLGFAALLGFRAVGVLRWFSVPTNAMSPAVKGGDNVLMRGRITPQRGDIIVFDTTDIPGLNAPGAPGQTYLKRLVGLPGETLRIADGQLYVDGQPMPMRNKEGEIHYTNNSFATYLRKADDTFTVPADSYFVLGDNSPNSADSRYWGPLQKTAVLGRIFYCYGPAARRGPVE